MIYAAQQGHLSIVKQLQDKGADLNTQTKVTLLSHTVHIHIHVVSAIVIQSY